MKKLQQAAMLSLALETATLQADVSQSRKLPTVWSLYGETAKTSCLCERILLQAIRRVAIKSFSVGRLLQAAISKVENSLQIRFFLFIHE